MSSVAKIFRQFLSSDDHEDVESHDGALLLDMFNEKWRKTIWIFKKKLENEISVSDQFVRISFILCK